jgi:hypothetical protein
MPTIGTPCHALRIQDVDLIWRIVYRIDPDAIVIAEVFARKTQTTSPQVIENCQRRLNRYDDVAKEKSSDGYEEKQTDSFGSEGLAVRFSGRVSRTDRRGGGFRRNEAGPERQPSKWTRGAAYVAGRAREAREL